MKKNVLIQLKPNHSLSMSHDAQSAGAFKKLSKSAIPSLDGLDIDMEFPPVGLPQLIEQKFDATNFNDTSENTEVDLNAPSESYIVRGVVDEKDLNKLINSAKKNKDVVDIFSDPMIETTATCSPTAIGNDEDVERLLNVSNLKNCKMEGKGVMVAIVDTGINMTHLNSKNKFPRFDAGNSWKPRLSNVVLGDARVGHGTMCAYDVCIAAPKCTLLDIALLAPRTTNTNLQGYLSDAILAYRHLINVMDLPRRIGENKSLVVNNSWGIYNLSSDFPVGHPGNYSDNPNHPFNRIVRTLERKGADILFAAGNCGEDCPSQQCQGQTSRSIYGANSSPYVTCVAGASVNKDRLGYSSIGPGRLANRKPDITGYTHFEGSDVYSYDSGTSAACPVVAGVVAAIRSKRPLDLSNSSTRPAAIRNLLTSSAQDLGVSGYDYRYGYGIVDTTKILDSLCKIRIAEPKFDLCKIFPHLCWYFDFCKRYPRLCDRIPRIPEIPHIPNIPRGPIPSPGTILGPDPRVYGLTNKNFNGDQFSNQSVGNNMTLEEAFQMGYLLAVTPSDEIQTDHKHHDCNCKET